MLLVIQGSVTQHVRSILEQLGTQVSELIANAMSTSLRTNDLFAFAPMNTSAPQQDQGSSQTKLHGTTFTWACGQLPPLDTLPGTGSLDVRFFAQLL